MGKKQFSLLVRCPLSRLSVFVFVLFLSLSPVPTSLRCAAHEALNVPVSFPIERMSHSFFWCFFSLGLVVAILPIPPFNRVLRPLCSREFQRMDPYPSVNTATFVSSPHRTELHTHSCWLRPFRRGGGACVTKSNINVRTAAAPSTTSSTRGKQGNPGSTFCRVPNQSDVFFRHDTEGRI